jgi:hypothetical protein
VPQLKVQHGIDAARLILPKCHFNQATCADGIEALRAYRRVYSELTKSFTDKPLHDWSSDYADSFRYLALVCKLKMKLPMLNAPQAAFVRLNEGVHSYGTLAQLFADNEKNKHQTIRTMRI